MLKIGRMHTKEKLYACKWKSLNEIVQIYVIDMSAKILIEIYLYCVHSSMKE